jgi:hypothetical protein
MKITDFYQGTADAMGVALYLYPDGSVTNSRKVGVEPTATIEPHERRRPAGDHGLGENILGLAALGPARNDLSAPAPRANKPGVPIRDASSRHRTARPSRSGPSHRRE